MSYLDPYSIQSCDIRYKIRDTMVPSLAGKDLDVGMFSGQMVNMQKDFNEVSPRPCCGFRYMRIRNGVSECRHPMCPSCWYRAQMKIIEHVIRTRAPYYYVRATDECLWNENFHPKVLSTFKGNGSRFHLLGYCLSIGGDYADLNECEEGTPFNGELYYRYVGIFAASTLIQIQEYDRNDKNGYVQIGISKKKEGDVIGVMEVDMFDDRFDAVQKYIERLGFPSIGRRHELYRDYVEKFSTKFYGKNWSRISCPSNFVFDPIKKFKELLESELKGTPIID